MKRQMEDLRTDLVEHLLPMHKTMIAGGMAGAVSKTVTAPLSRLTILYQVASMSTTALAAGKFSPSLSAGLVSGSLWNALSNIVRSEGVIALWKGNLTSVLHKFPYSAINFTTFKSTKDILTDEYDLEETTLVRFVCGAVSGGAACFACYPLDLVRTRLTVLDEGERRNGIFRLIWRILRKEGIKGLYKGCSISCAVSVPNLAISFSVYGAAKERILMTKTFTDPVGGHVTFSGSMLCGASSGVIASLVMFPADLIRRRMQVRGALDGIYRPTGQPAFKMGLISEIRKIFRKEGIRGFYNGIVPEILKVTPMVAVTFMVYELSMEFMS